jgi:hypothetical protein
LCQIAAVSARGRCRTRAQTPGFDAAAVAFEVELGLEGLVDRLDDWLWFVPSRPGHPTRQTAPAHGVPIGLVDPFASGVDSGQRRVGRS